jgi:hypothetical protein
MFKTDEVKITIKTDHIVWKEEHTLNDGRKFWKFWGKEGIYISGNLDEPYEDVLEKYTQKMIKFFENYDSEYLTREE